MMNKPSPTRRYAKKLSVAAGSLSALAVGAQEADAAIFYFGPEFARSASIASGGTTWDVDFSGGTDFQLSVAGTNNIGLASDDSPTLGGLGVVRVAGLPTSFAPAIQNLNSGFDALKIGANLNSPYEFGAPAQRYLIAGGQIGGYALDFSADGNNFIGFRFNGSTGTIGTQYGWARIDIDLGEEEVTIAEWAYEDTGGDILVGATPEPSSFALMAAGATGVLAWKRRRRKTGAESETDA